MYPSRPAPSPPKGASLPPNHPFATYYIPPHHTSHSVSSFATSSPPTSPKGAACASRSRRSQSPTASSSPPARTITHLAPDRTPTFLPAELAIFDHKSRQTLLYDFEFIAGKKLSFPFINRLLSDKGNKGEERTRGSCGGSD